MHIHPQLSILIRGASETLPANVGINRDLWRDHSLDRYGVNGLSSLLTRDSSGTIHVESNTVRDFTLYEFLAIWGEPTDYSQVVGNPVRPGESACIFVNGQSMSLSSNVVFVDQQKIILEIPPNSQPCSAVSSACLIYDLVEYPISRGEGSAAEPVAQEKGEAGSQRGDCDETVRTGTARAMIPRILKLDSRICFNSTWRENGHRPSRRLRKLQNDERDP
jgi:hypothetical protein